MSENKYIEELDIEIKYLKKIEIPKRAKEEKDQKTRVDDLEKRILDLARVTPTEIIKKVRSRFNVQ
jgi:hypothetical protein